MWNLQNEGDEDDELAAGFNIVCPRPGKIAHSLCCDSKHVSGNLNAPVNDCYESRRYAIKENPSVKEAKISF